MRPAALATGLTLALLVPVALLAQDGSLVQGSVRDATSGRRVDGVTVSFGEGLTTLTDSRGRFQLKDVPAGTHHVRLSRIGYRPKTFDLPIESRDAGDDIFVDATLEPLPIQLEPLEVRGDTSTIVAYGRLADFYRRRRMGLGGRYFTREDIERRNAFYVSDLLRTVPGAWMRSDRWGDRYVTFRGGRCLPVLWLDGARVPYGFGGLDNWVTPEQVEAIEVYNSGLATPMELWGLGTGGCGAIAIWTR